MRATTLRTLLQLRVVHDFLARLEWAPSATIAPRVDELAEVIADIERTTTELEVAHRRAKVLTGEIDRLARMGRFEFLKALAAAARDAGHRDPVIARAFTYSHRTERHDDVETQLLAAADLAMRHLDTLERTGITAEGIARMRECAEALRRARKERAFEYARRAGAKDGALAAVARGRTLVSLNDSIVRPRLSERSPALLGEWEARLKTGRVRRRRRPEPPPAPDEP